jgi:hypothetical protein
MVIVFYSICSLQYVIIAKVKRSRFNRLNFTIFENIQENGKKRGKPLFVAVYPLVLFYLIMSLLLSAVSGVKIADLSMVAISTLLNA